ncbi:DNA-binding LacI/PurR family transcriptional regulator [Caldalkalibacillus uzonensis]|uniref:DNA-binding LacI/PurR family transcriptional regulator n=1 Tax=Caldalkalibacillus uzonensis TaxID=353224 RepID=A0ABU0CQM6_9BACI|nr:LacI family DNA-binding transcriptional regulator [Caldalkalibacillus uzonensis]MDQ0338711.1 DNA-binding LacI/PurR family transcriptional regulator [Caldalkalibacillus uzonensis]
MSTIRDVAKRAQVSVATVSRVINNSGYVQSETRERVLKAMQDLNYKPNAIAQSLNHKKTRNIALVVPDITNPFFPELARAVEDVARIYGYTVILCNSDEDLKKEQGYMDIIQQKYIDGLILVSHTLKLNHLIDEVPVVLLDRLVDQNIPTVTAKNYEGAILATRHLLDIGCRKIGHICGPKYIPTAQRRLQGYLHVVEQMEWFSDSLIVEGNFQLELAKEATLHLLAEHADIDGIFAGNDLMAVGALKAIHQTGRKVPQDIALIGFDGIFLSKAMEPELSTVAQPIYDMGAIATRLLLKKIEDQPIDSAYHELDVTLLQRASTRR